MANEVTPLPRHSISDEDSSAELAHCIAEWINNSRLYKEWSIWPGYPGHFLRLNYTIEDDTRTILILPKMVVPITSMREGAPTFHYDQKIDAHDPEFFEKLGSKLLEIQGNDIQTIWRPR